jgi:hypothetical protein
MSDPGRRTIEISPREFVALGGDLLTITVPAPLPPGSRVGIALPCGVPAATGKVVAVRRSPEDTVELDVRLSSLSREQRQRLAAAVTPRA